MSISAASRCRHVDLRRSATGDAAKIDICDGGGGEERHRAPVPLRCRSRRLPRRLRRRGPGGMVDRRRNRGRIPTRIDHSAHLFDEDRPLRDQRLGGALLEGLMAHAHGAPRRHDGGPSCDEAPTCLPEAPTCLPEAPTCRPDAPLCPRPPACPDVPPDVPLCFPTPRCAPTPRLAPTPSTSSSAGPGRNGRSSSESGAHSDEDRPLCAPIPTRIDHCATPDSPTCAPGHAE